MSLEVEQLTGVGDTEDPSFTDTVEHSYKALIIYAYYILACIRQRRKAD